MDKRLKKFMRRAHLGRSTVLAVLFTVMSFVLLNRLYQLQIIDGANYRSNFILTTTKTRTVKASRGNIYDRNGRPLATNELSYSLTIEDSGTYPDRRSRPLALNGEAYRIAHILARHGDALSMDFHIVVDEQGNYAFDVSGTALNRFRADVYGRSRIDELKAEEMNATPDQMIDYLVDFFALLDYRNVPFTAEEKASVGLPESLTRQDILNILYVRYMLWTKSYQKYIPVTIAKNLHEETVAELAENKATLTGIEIVEDTIRVYAAPECFASLIGYTGPVSAEELSELKTYNSNYNTASIVGKSGIEKIMETELQGFDGQETVYVDNLGKILAIDENAAVEPQAGNNVYLTIDLNLQQAVYDMLEQRIAAVLETNIIDAKTFDTSEVRDTASIKIPSYDVYNAIIENNVIDIDRFTAPDASGHEQLMAQRFSEKQQEIFAWLENELTGPSPSAYRDLSKEMMDYQSYIINDFLTTRMKILDSSKVDKTDATYLAWTRDESISLKEYLTYAASKNWIDVSAFATDDTYLDSGEIYAKLASYIEDRLTDDKTFSKKLYKYLLLDDRIGARDILNVCYDQGVFDVNDNLYDAWQNQEITNYELVLQKIHRLELTPAMLALDPCSGSAVVTNPRNGEYLAVVTYPGYDNNRLANTMDSAYYARLAADESRPFYNKATQQTTAPGSTFKLVTTTAGLEEGAITRGTIFNCQGTFDLIETPLNCWYRSGHGELDVVGGIMNSCNVFFCNVAYQLGINEEGQWSDSLSLSKLQNYARMYSLDQPSGIEVPEASPKVSDQYAVPSSIGQGTHAYTTTQMARYVSTLANGGISYNLSMIDKVTDTDGNLMADYAPTIAGNVSIATSTWEAIHEGMRNVILSKEQFADVAVSVAGKTGTAQESKSRPSHALFIAYAPYEDPQIALTVRIGNGYSSTNAMMVGKDIIQYYFNLTDEGALLTGRARTDSISSAQVD